MLRNHHILPLLWLALLASPLAYAASCPVDSIIGYSENSTPISKTIYGYDEAGRTILEEFWYSNSDSVLYGSSKTTTEYYTNGKVKSTAYYTWSTETNDWMGISRQDYVYNDQGLTTSRSEWVWSTATNSWRDSIKYEYTYNDKGSTLTYSIYHWSVALSNWTYYSRYEYTYDYSNRKIKEIYFLGSGTTWTPQSKQEYNFDQKGNKTLDLYYSGYNASTKQWIGSYWYIYGFDSNNRTILTEKYNWDTNKNDWVGTEKMECNYNAAGKQTLYAFYTWDDIASSFVGSKKIIYDYDQWTNTILNEQYQGNNGIWVGIGKVRYEYTAYNSDPIMTATFQWDNTLASFIGVDSIRTASDEAKNTILDERYTYNVTNQAWAGTFKEEYSYNADKLILSTIAYSWNVTKAQWGYNTKVLADYDSHKNQTKDERYQWTIDASLTEGGYWKGTKYEVTTYNDKNVETDKIIYQWDDTNRRWLGSSKSIYEFDAAGHLILEEQYTWSLDPSIPAGGEWHGTKKEEFGYNAANQQTKAITYAWSDAINDWIGQTKKISNFDSYKNQILNEQYTWVIETTETGGYWRGTEKEEYTFNANKQQTSSLIYTWDDTNRDWTYVSKTQSTYDQWKNLTLDERYEWQSGAWVGTLKKEYAYNAKGQQIMFAYYAWDETKSAFVGTQKEEDEWDDAGQLIMHADYTWGTTTWTGKSKSNYTYNDDVQIATEIKSKWVSNAWVYSTKTENTYTDTKVTSYILYNWISNAWVKDKRWEQVDANTENTYEWWNNSWSLTQHTAKEYDTHNKLVREVDENYSHGTQTSGSKTEYTYTGDLLTQQSAYTFASDWVETDRITNTYDGENRQTNTTTYTNIGGSMVYVSKVDNEYAGQNITTTSYTWTGSAWQGVEKEEKIYSNLQDYTSTKYEWREGGWFGLSKTGYAYYTDGKEKEVIDYLWSSSAWVEDTKTAYEYSGTKNIVTSTYLWQSGAWVGQSREGVYYDEGEDLTTATWTWSGGTWVGKTKLGESHDADGNLTGQTTYSWQNGVFVYNKKTEITYDGPTIKDKTTATYTYNTTNQAWVGVSKSGVTYSGANKTSETSYTWISGFTWQPNQKKEYEYGEQAKDLTTAIYSWNTTDQAWVGVSKSGVTYAANGKQASEFSYVWGDTCWLNVSKTEWEYGDGKNNAVATYKGVDTAWVGIQKYEEKYTSTGDSLGFYTYCWKDGAWSDSLKQTFEYDDHGNIIYHIYAQWKNNDWVNQTTSRWWEITYDENDSILIDAHYKWNRTKGWIGTGNRFEYTYFNGKLVLYLQYTWNSNKWTYSYKNEWQYDEKDSLILYLYQQYSTSKRAWLFGSKNEYAYSSSGICTMTANYTWNSSRQTPDWQGISKTEDVLDDKDSVIANISYAWDYSNWTWVSSYKYEYKYDEQGRMIEQLVSRYNTTTNQWRYDTQNTYLYDSYGRTIESASNTWNDSVWIPRTQQKYIYEEDPYTRLRTQLDATWNNGIVQKYEDKNTYYHCDPKFTITVNTSEEGVGEVTSGGVYTYYARPKIAAIESPGCDEFHQWNDGDTLATRRILVTQDQTYTASFTPVLRTIRGSVSPSGGGSVSVILKKDD